MAYFERSRSRRQEGKVNLNSNCTYIKTLDIWRLLSRYRPDQVISKQGKDLQLCVEIPGESASFATQ
jgi:hypothetical protein